MSRQKNGNEEPVIDKQNDESLGNLDSETKAQNLDDSIFKTPTSCNNSYIRSASRNGRNVSKMSASANQSMMKCKSIPMITDKHFYTPRSSVKDKSITSTPVTHMCSPSLSPKGRRHFTQHNRSIVKRFLSDSSLNGSTPDCTDGTPVQDNMQTSQHLEEETSNFVVGVRVRPLNFR